MGQSISLSNSVSGGTWVSGAVARATVGISSGIVNGVATGTANITYSQGGGCTAVTRVTVNPAVATITGSMSVCVGQTVTLANTTAGGTWISGASSIASVVGSTGVVTGAVAGTVNITYMVGSGCFKSASVTVRAVPAAISGPSTVAVGSTVTLTNSSPTGTWSSSSVAVASVGSLSGVVSGVNTGSAIITYRVPSTGCFSTLAMTVSASKPAVVSENVVGSVFDVFPNPTKGVLYINTSVSGELFIIAVDGRIVGHQSLSAGENAYVLAADLASGLYICRFVESDGTDHTSRLVVEH
jgi:uncharacterized protein YjdB